MDTKQGLNLTMLALVLLLQIALSETQELAFTSSFPTHKLRRSFSITSPSMEMNAEPENVNMSSNFNDDEEFKVCIVTGASRGIGKCIAKELARYATNTREDAVKGATTKNLKIVINHIASEAENAKSTLRELEEMGIDSIAVEADCSKPDEIKDMFRQVMSTYGRCDILVNNAGITRDALVLRMKPEQWEQVLKLNLSGVHYCTQEFFKHSKNNVTGGKIINIASVVGQIGNIGQANYGAAKAGVIGLTKCNAKEFAKRGITVNAVCPGFIETGLTAILGEDKLSEISQTIPLGRLGRPEEVAGLVRFLALDPVSDYITGHTFNIDGGIAIGV